MATAHFQFDRVAKRREAHEFHRHADGEAEFHDPAFCRARQGDCGDPAALPRCECAEWNCFSRSLAHGLRGKALDLDVIAKLTPKRDASTEQQTNNGRTVCDFPDYRAVVEPHLAQTDTVRTVRADMPYTQALTTFGCGESKLWRSG